MPAGDVARAASLFLRLAFTVDIVFHDALLANIMHDRKALHGARRRVRRCIDCATSGEMPQTVVPDMPAPADAMLDAAPESRCQAHDMREYRAGLYRP